MKNKEKEKDIRQNGQDVKTEDQKKGANKAQDDQNQVIEEEIEETEEIPAQVPEANAEESDEDSNKEEKQSDPIEQKLAEIQDKYIRLSAEFDNYRKRTLKEKMELTRLAGEDILKNLLPVLDDFERAVKSVSETDNIDAVRAGIDLIYTKLRDFLTSNGIKEIEAQKKDFDADLHEAITKIPVADQEMKGKVVDVVEKGYYLHDKIIRYAKVVVGE